MQYLLETHILILKMLKLNEQRSDSKVMNTEWDWKD